MITKIIYGSLLYLSGKHDFIMEKKYELDIDKHRKVPIYC